MLVKLSNRKVNMIVDVYDSVEFSVWLGLYP